MESYQLIFIQSIDLCLTVYQRALFLDISRTWNNSNNDYDLLRDKDIYSIAVGVFF